MDDNIAKIPYHKQRTWEVRVSKQVQKGLPKLPKKIQWLLKTLILDLMEYGPIQHEWPNYSKLKEGVFHCHLNYRFVAVWRMVDEEVRIMEVRYAGSRENAPY
jgi:mRNA-degrading endonuclease RelE of RelBE toxin-antitoxin system